MHIAILFKKYRNNEHNKIIKIYYTCNLRYITNQTVKQYFTIKTRVITSYMI